MPWPAPYDRIPPFTDLPHVVNSVVEIPKGSRNKYEMCKKTGLIRLDRYLYSASHYPGDYGFVPQTLAGDNDPLDIVVMVNDASFSGCLIETRLVGMFRLKDRGQQDFKLLGVPHSDPLFAEYRSLSDVPRHFLREVEHFFTTYKQLEGAVAEAFGWAPVQEAVDEVRASVERYRQMG